MQTLPLFDSEVVEKEFELSFDSKHKEQFGSKFVSRSVYIRRSAAGVIERGCKKPNKKDYTFISIGGLNFLGEKRGVEFRFITDTDGQRFNNDVLLSELNTLPKERVVEFAENVIQRLIDGEFQWCYEDRKKIYNTKLF